MIPTTNTPELDLGTTFSEYSPTFIQQDPYKGFTIDASRIQQLSLKQLSAPTKTPQLEGLLAPNGNPNAIKQNDGFYDIHESHTLSSSGKWIPKYDQFFYDIDNEEYQAQKQGFLSDWTKGLKNYGVTVGTGVVGGVLGLPYGLIESVATGSAEALLDNTLTTALDEWREDVQIANTVYQTEEEKNDSLFSNVTQSSFLAGKVLQPVGEIVGTIASEAIWAAIPGPGWAKIAASSGKSLSRLGRAGRVLGNALIRGGDNIARAGLTSTSKATQAGLRAGVRAALKKAPKSSADYKKLSSILGKETGKKLKTINKSLGNMGLSDEALETVRKYTNAANRRGQITNTMRFLVTSSVYEAGIEERSYQKLAQQEFIDYHRDNDIEITQEEVENFASTLNDNTNNVFAINMAVLGASNSALFGKYFKAFSFLKNPAKNINKTIDTKFFKLGTKANEKGVYEALNAKWYNKTARQLKNISTGFTTEALEEGSQGIASTTYGDFVKSSYNKEYIDKTDTVLKSFNNAVKEQFTTKEGLEEMFIGGLIGGGVKVVDGTFGKSEYKKQEAIAKVQNKLTKDAKQTVNALFYTQQDVTSKVARLNRDHKLSDDLDRALAENDALAIEQAKTKEVASKMEQAYAVGKEDFFEDVLAKTVDETSDEKVAEMFDLTLREAKQYKEDLKADIKGRFENYRENRKFAENLFGNGRIGGVTKTPDGKELSTQNLINAVAFGLTMGETSRKVLQDSFGLFDTLISEGIATESLRKKVGGVLTLLSLDNEARQHYDSLIEKRKTLKEKISLLTDLITEAGTSDTKGEVTSLKENSIELAKLNQELADTENAINVLKSDMVDTLKLGKFSEIELDTLEQQLKDLKDTIDALPEKNKMAINKLLDTTTEAIEHYKSYDSMVSNLIDPNFRFQTYRGIFGSKIAPNLSINEFTKQAILDMYEPVSREVDIPKVTQTITADDISDIEETPFPTPTGLVTSPTVNRTEVLEDIYDSDILLQQSEDFSRDDLGDIEEVTMEDIERYEELLDQEEKTNEELEEQENLRKKLFRFQVAKGSDYADTNLLDLVRLNRQLKQKYESKPKKTVNEGDLGTLVDTTDSKKLETQSSEKVTNTYESAYVSKGGTRIHHLSLLNFFNLVKKYLGEDLRIEFSNNQTPTEDDILRTDIFGGVVFAILDSNDNVIVGGTLNNKGQIILNNTTINELFGDNIKTVRFENQKTNYLSLYERNTDGTFSPITVDFTDKRSYPEKLAYNVTEGSEVTLKHSFKDPFNQRLLTELFGPKPKGKDTREQEAIHSPEYIQRAHIDVTYGSRQSRVGGLNTSTDKTPQAFNAMREKVITERNIKTTVEKVYINRPNVSLDEDGNPITMNLSRNDKNVEGFYVAKKNADGKLVFQDNVDNVDHRFVEAVSKEHSTIYYAVFKMGKTAVSYPVEVEPQIVDVFDDLAQDIEGANVDKTLLIVNNYIRAYGIQTPLVSSLSDINLDVFREVPVYPDNLNNVDTVKSFVPGSKPFLKPKFKLEIPPIDTSESTNTKAKPAKVKKNNNNICKK